MCVCSSVHIISLERHVRSSPMHVTHGRGPVLLWRRSDTLCTSDFMDDVIFDHKPRLLDVAAHTQRTCSLGLGYELCAVIPVAGQQTHGTTFRALKVTSLVATSGAESAVYDWLVYFACRAGSGVHRAVHGRVSARTQRPMVSLSQSTRSRGQPSHCVVFTRALSRNFLRGSVPMSGASPSPLPSLLSLLSIALEIGCHPFPPHRSRPP